MDKSILTKHRSVLGKPRWLTGTRLLGLIAIAVVFALSAAQTAGAAQDQKRHLDDGGRILLAANDAHAAETAKTDAENSDKKDAQKAEAKAPSGPPPSKFWLVNVLRSNVALTLFLTLALGYFIGSIKIGHFSLGAVTGTLKWPILMLPIK